MIEGYYTDLSTKLKALPADPINMADMIAKAVEPIQKRVTSLELQVDKIPDLQADIEGLLYQLDDDAKKGEGYMEEGQTEDQFVEKQMQALQAAVHLPPRPELSQVSAEYQTSRHHSKRPREDEDQSPQSKKRLYTTEEKTIPAHIQRVSQKLLPKQDLKQFGDKELLVSHGKRFRHIDKWVPIALNDWYEGQREVFIKWYYVFANISRSQVTEAEAWRYFLYYHAHKSEVRKLEEAAAKADVKDIPVPSYKSVSPPMTGKSVSIAEIEFELKSLASIFKLPTDQRNEEFKTLKRNLYKVYGQNSRL